MARKRYTEEQIVGILKEGAAGARTEELCRKHGISPNTFYAWRTKFVGMTIPDIKKMRTLEDENRRLKMKVAELTLDIDTVKELLRKNF
jgi:putative transposase